MLSLGRTIWSDSRYHTVLIWAYAIGIALLLPTASPYYIGMMCLVLILVGSLMWGTRGAVVSVAWATILSLVSEYLADASLVKLAAAILFYWLVGVLIGYAIERIRARERSLLEYRSAIEQANDGIAFADMDGNIRFANQAWAKMHGFSVEDLVGQHLSMFHTPEQLETEVKAFSEALLRQGANDGEVSHARKDGTVFPTWMSATVVKDSGRPLGLVGTARDISKQKQIEESTRRSEELLKGTQELAHLGSWAVDHITNQAMWSDEMYRMYGLQPQQSAATYEVYLETVHADDRERVDTAYIESLHGGGDGCDIEYRIVPSGTDEVRYVYERFTHERDSEGTVVRSMGMIHDITEQKHARGLLQSRLDLIEFSGTHSLEEVLRKTLDEACELTSSTIGFYHFIDDDEKTVILKAWSTRTLKEFCQIEGKDTHYSIDEAGVWVDCVRQRKPIIHNDYESIPHRKGMPEGHAAVTRELVVPIMRQDRIVAILGVGNKPQDYSEKDLDAIAHFAEVAWEIAERKQAEAKHIEYTTGLELQSLEMDRLYSLLDREMQHARRAHQRLLQQEESLCLEGLSMATLHSPATLIGGDFSYAIQKGDFLIVYVSDITGHGLEGTIFSLFVRDCIESYIELLPESEMTPDRILRYLDQQVRKGGYPSEYAVAIFLMVINVVTREVTFSAAGFQNSPVLVQEDGAIAMLDSYGLPISPDIPVEVVEFEHHATQLPENALVFLSTDGIYEQVCDEHMYEPGLLALLEQCAGLPVDTVADLVDNDFHAFCGESEQSDDVTCVVLSTLEVEEYSMPSRLSSIEATREYVLTYYQDHHDREGIAMAVHELVANAIEHGNRCDEEKSVRIVFSDRAVVIEDEGDGFDWRERVQGELSFACGAERGRGIIMVGMLVGELVYNEKGNRVSLLLEG